MQINKKTETIKGGGFVVTFQPLSILEESNIGKYRNDCTLFKDNLSCGQKRFITNSPLYNMYL